MKENSGMMWPKAMEKALISRLARSTQASGIMIASRERPTMIPSFLIPDQTTLNIKSLL